MEQATAAPNIGVEEFFALPDGAAIKLFLLNGMTNAPLCQSETVKNP